MAEAGIAEADAGKLAANAIIPAAGSSGDMGEQETWEARSLLVAL